METSLIDIRRKQLLDQQYNTFVSIILPVYQGEAFIMNAVRSVLNQTYPYFELIVVDDGSTDTTLKELSLVKDKRLKIITQANQGTAVARNNGLTYAKGDYIGFIDADDVWLPNKLEVELLTISNSPNRFCIVYSWYYGVDENNRLVSISPSYRVRGDIFDTVLYKESVLLPSTTLFHRYVFETLGGFPTSQYHEDRSFSLKAVRYFPAYPTKQRLVIYRQSVLGKCRSVLSNYDLALTSVLSVPESLKDTLSAAEVEQLTKVEIRNLFYRFLMYNFMGSARKLYSNTGSIPLSNDKKAVLAKLSMLTRVNLMFYSRVIIQFFTKQLLFPWWRLKIVSIYQLLQEVMIDAYL